MGTVGIRDIGVYLPENVLTKEELVRRLDFDNDFLMTKVGVARRHLASESEASSDLSIKSAEKIFQANESLRREDIDLLIVCTQNPDFKLPNTASIVQSELGLRDTIASFDINLGCSGFVYSSAVALSMMQVYGFKNALISTADIYSKILNPQDRNTVAIFGDAGATVWLNHEARNEVLKFTFGTDGKGYDALIVRGGGSRNPLTSESLESDSRLFMDGRAIFDFMMRRVPRDIQRCLEINKLSMDQIDYFVFHQASKYLLDCLAKRMSIPEEKMVYSLENTGNTVSSTIPVALKQLMGTRALSGRYVVISGFGVGLSWATTVLHFR